MALGGAAATKFASKGGAYQTGDVTYKSSQDVREHYVKQMEATTKKDNMEETSSLQTELPIGWGAREKEKAIIAKQQGVFAATASPVATHSCSKPSTTSTITSSSKAEVALLQLTTNSLEALASVLESSNGGISMPSDDRAKFASAMKRAMDALAKCR